MRLEIEVGGRVRQVSLEQRERPDRFRFTMDGRVLDVDAALVDRNTWSLLLTDGSQHLVSVSGTPVSGFTVHVPAGDLAVTMPGAGRRARVPGAEASPSGPVRIVAPMPGKVVRVLVTMGQAVAAGQGIVVVEAMKMENELRTSRGGVVTELRAIEGASVEAGVLLAVVG
jgi:biotin carboxyl carrier protein